MVFNTFGENTVKLIKIINQRHVDSFVGELLMPNLGSSPQFLLRTTVRSEDSYNKLFVRRNQLAARNALFVIYRWKPCRGNLLRTFSWIAPSVRCVRCTSKRGELAQVSPMEYNQTQPAFGRSYAPCYQ